MWLVDALDAIFKLAATWKLLYQFKHITWWRKAIVSLPQGNKISTLNL
jgi:hypothetical protein